MKIGEVLLSVVLAMFAVLLVHVVSHDIKSGSLISVITQLGN